MNKYFLQMATDNLKADENLVGFLNGLSQEELLADRGAFFKNIEDTFSHLVSASVNYTAVLSNYLPNRGLSSEKFESLPYSVAREQQILRDKQIVALCEALTEQELEIEVDIYNMKATVGWVLYRYFVHAIHHRGQLSQILDEMKIEHDWLSFHPENYYTK